MEKYFVKRLPKPIPETYNNPHVDYWDGQDSTSLYLCSRDIQVGDKVYHDSIIFNKGFTWTDSHENKMRKDDVFKVIGEILTPGIQEGQEFTEEETEYLTIGK